MNDIMINWKKISKGMPVVKSYSDDRVPTMAEIHQLLEHPDRRIKTIVLVMTSSGIRVGSWDYLQWKHVVPIERNNNVIAAKLIIKNTKIHNRIYYSFVTPEAYYSLNAWMDHFGLYKFQCHCSGHARSKDLFQIIEEINADSFYPVHTTHPEIYKKRFTNVVDVIEGRTYSLY